MSEEELENILARALLSIQTQAYIEKAGDPLDPSSAGAIRAIYDIHGGFKEARKFMKDTFEDLKKLVLD